MISILADWLGITGVLCLLFAVVISPLVFFSIGRKFDKKFGKVDLLFLETGLSLFSRLWRVNCYMFCIIYPKIPIMMRDKPDPYFWNWFKDYNFRENASKFQVILSYIYVLSALLGVLSLVISYLLSFFV